MLFVNDAIVWEVVKATSPKKKHLLSNNKAIKFAKKNCVVGGHNFLHHVAVNNEIRLLEATNVFGLGYTFTKRQWEIYTNV